MTSLRSIPRPSSAADTVPGRAGGRRWFRRRGGGRRWFRQRFVPPAPVERRATVGRTSSVMRSSIDSRTSSMAASSSSSTRWASTTRPSPPSMPANTSMLVPSQPSKRCRSRPLKPATWCLLGRQSFSVCTRSSRARSATRSTRIASASASRPSDARASDGWNVDLDAGDVEPAVEERRRRPRRRRRRVTADPSPIGRPSTVVPLLDRPERDGAGVVGHRRRGRLLDLGPGDPWHRRRRRRRRRRTRTSTAATADRHDDEGGADEQRQARLLLRPAAGAGSAGGPVGDPRLLGPRSGGREVGADDVSSA